jgi:methionyl-tRNA synthetase
VNYISFAHYDPLAPFDAQPETFRKFWPALHVIGKDIMIPAHGIYWPIMLKALGFPDNEIPPLLVHGWWNIDGEKMSKTLGNIVDPDALADKYGAEAVRYYLMSDITTGRDADFGEDRLKQRYNTDLANSLGNLLNRAISMAQRYRAGALRRPAAGLKLDAAAATAIAGYDKTMLDFEIHRALAHVIEFAVAGNGFVEEVAPWKLAKDPAQAEKLDAVLYELAESLRIIAILISPAAPKAAHGIFDQLNWKPEESGKATRFALADTAWGGLPDGHIVGKPVPLFPRIEEPKP